jgi:hypothetical protein
MIIPKRLEKIFYLYPFIQVIELGLAIYFQSIITFLLILYFQSPLIWRVLRRIYGQPVGTMQFGKHEKEGCLWFVLLQLQHIYISFPFIERILMVVPDLFSGWLRMWGSTIGNKVMWTPEVTIYDRTHLNIGDRVLFGSKVMLSCHVVNKRDRKYTVMVAPIEIGNDAFLGYETSVGPGVVLGARSFTEVRSIVFPNTVVEAGGKHVRK